MVFTRSTDDNLASLVKQIDVLVAEHADDEEGEANRLASFINFLGPEAKAIEEEATEFASSHDLENVALAVPIDCKNGPEIFSINPDAETTVMIYKDVTVKATHAVGSGELDDSTVATILQDVHKILH